MRIMLPAAVAVLGLVGGSACAGVIFTSTHTNLETQQSGPATAFIESDRLKIVTPDNIVIFRADQNKVWVVRSQQQTYVEITADALRALGARLSGPPDERLQARLAQLPPAQRAAVEAQLKGVGAPPPPVTYAKAGAGKTVGNWRCEAYAKTVAGEKQSDLCIAPIASTGLNDGDLRVLETFSAFMGPIANSPLAPRTDYLNWNDMSKAIGFRGIPLESTVYIGGKAALTETVQKIERADIPADAFELPPGLTRQQMGAGR